LTTKLFGGEVEGSNKREYGQMPINISNNEAGIFEDLEETETVLMSHSDLITKVPEGFTVTASNESTPIAAFENTERQIYGVQFHPEVRASVHGNDMLRNFIFNICNVSGEWSMENFIDRKSTRLNSSHVSISYAVFCL